MPPKFDPNDPATAQLIEKFQLIGLSSSKATEAARSPKNAANLSEFIDKYGLSTKGLDDKQGSLISSLASQGDKLGETETRYIIDAVVDKRLQSADQVSAAVKYLTAHPAPVNEAEFNAECGVGVSLTPEEVLSRFKEYLASQTVAGWSVLSSTINSAKQTSALRWANPLELKKAADSAFTELFGPKEQAKEQAKAKAKEPKPPKAATPAASAESSAKPPEVSERSVFAEGFLGRLHKPGGNPQIRPRLREEHLAFTAGKVFTRFPPEPSGYLHLGHSKAIFINFGYAAYHSGHCYLRYDDTNPEAEEGRYFESILEVVRWLGYEPYKVTYSSDYFQRLYDLAIELIRRDKAYICHCTGEQINADRGGESHGARRACVHRNRPIEESITEFEAMKNGKYKPGEAILRMKQDLEDGNPQMWDLIAYRVVETPHHRTGDTWRIYPTYDYTHCLVDSFENISHSLCTTEFVSARQSYEWLCDALEVYKPRQSEFGRFNLTGTITSKRRLKKLINAGYVRDWDDPRLYTVVALRRRGVPPQAIISFVAGLGVSTAITNIETPRFDQSVRQYLELTVPRLLMVLHPLKVTLENVPEGHVVMLEKPLHPKVPELGKSSIPFTRTIYIEKEDFRTEDSKDYFRLAPGKTVGLFQGPHPITCLSFKTDPTTGEVTELICRLEDGVDKLVAPKPKAFIQWVAEHPVSGSPVVVDEARIFHRLFKSENPAAEKDFLQDVNSNSLEIAKGAMVEVGFWPLAKNSFAAARKEALERTNKALAAEKAPQDDDTPHPTVDQLVGKEVIRFQGLRVAYFAVDKESQLGCLEDDGAAGHREGDRLILNRIVSLKEDVGKNV